MSDETHAVDGANPAAPVENEATEQVAVEQETSAAPAEAEQGQETERDEQGRFKRRDAQERINELTRARRQAERERDFYRQQAEQRQSEQTAPNSQKPPAFEDFGDLNEWGKAIAERAAQEARAVASQEFAQRQQQAQVAQVFQSYEVRERQYAAANPGYQDAMAALQSTVRFGPELIEVLGASDAGPAIVHYLGEHLDAADRLQRLPPHLAAAELVRIEARVTAPKQKPVSKTPSPAPVLGGGGAANQDPEQMTTDEWLAWRRKQLKTK